MSVTRYILVLIVLLTARAFGGALTCNKIFAATPIKQQVNWGKVNQKLADLEDSIIEEVGEIGAYSPAFESAKVIQDARKQWKNQIGEILILAPDPSDLILAAQKFPVSFELILLAVSERASHYSNEEQIEIVLNIPRSWLKSKVAFLLQPFLKNSASRQDRSVLHRLDKLEEKDEYTGEHSAITAVWLIHFLHEVSRHSNQFLDTPVAPWPKTIRLHKTTIHKELYPIFERLGFQMSILNKHDKFFDVKLSIPNTSKQFSGAKKLSDVNFGMLHAAGIGAATHDVGKIYIPIEILNKPSRFTEDEFAIMSSHALGTYAIVHETMTGDSRQEWLPLVGLLHHERWDGKGYPLGLKGEQIPMVVRAMSIVDTFHAMTSDRPYRNGLSYERAANILLAEADKGQFDPNLIRAFVKMIRESKEK